MLFKCRCLFLLLVSFCGSETPLSVAVQSALPMEAIRVLVQGGAHLDFRNRDGFTALHKAVWAQNHAGLLVRTAEQHCTLADHKQNKSTQWELKTRSYGGLCLKKPRNCAFLLVLPGSPVTRSIPKLQGPLWPDSAVPHCTGRGRHLLLRDPAVLPGDAGDQG